MNNIKFITGEHHDGSTVLYFIDNNNVIRYIRDFGFIDGVDEEITKFIFDKNAKHDLEKIHDIEALEEELGEISSVISDFVNYDDTFDVPTELREIFVLINRINAYVDSVVIAHRLSDNNENSGEYKDCYIELTPNNLKEVI